MHLTTENILLVGSILLFISLLAGKTSYKLGIPVLIFFLGIGMLAGSEGLGGINFDSPRVAQFIGVIALNFILFSGGFDTSWDAVKPVIWHGITLSTLGVLLTAIILGIFVWIVTDFTIYEGLLLGSIVSSTDSAAVFNILRSKNVALKGNIRPLLELESGSNDPMAYVLTITFTGLVVNQDATLLQAIPVLLKQLALGAIMGLLLGRAGKWLINNSRLDYESLYIVMVIAIMMFSFAATDFIGGNGFLAVYLCAIYLGNQELIHKKKIIKSFDSYAWLMQMVLFLTLGLLVFPSHVVPVIFIGLLISVFLIVVARPVSVFLSLYFFKVQNRTRWFVSWVGLRGAVPIVFATYPLLAGAEKANMIFNIVFFISLTSVLIQGTTIPIASRWLHLSIPIRVKQRTQIDIELSESAKSLLTEIVIPDGCNAIGKQLVDLKLPKTALISFIQRNSQFITPNGATRLKPNDKLYVISENKQDVEKVFETLDIKDKPN